MPTWHPHSVVGRDGYVAPPKKLIDFMAESLRNICVGLDLGHPYHVMTATELLDQVEKERRQHALEYPGYCPRSRRSFGTQTEGLHRPMDL